MCSQAFWSKQFFVEEEGMKVFWRVLLTACALLVCVWLFNNKMPWVSIIGVIAIVAFYVNKAQKLFNSNNGGSN